MHSSVIVLLPSDSICRGVESPILYFYFFIHSNFVVRWGSLLNYVILYCQMHNYKVVICLSCI